jgi:CubicO group peptidase (beta-lactamase class C family)
VLVAQRDRILLSRGYGLADRSASRPVGSATLFDIGSLSKQFTAAAVLAAAEEGRLDLHGSISRVLRGVPRDKEAVTVHHLLTHTAGIADGTDDGIVRSRDEVVQAILKGPLAATPGREYAYSNDGYTLLAAMVELSSGETFERYLARKLFGPAGMERTTVTWDSMVADSSLALGYGGYIAPAEGESPRVRPHTWRGRGSGNVLSSVDDLMSWHRALRGGRVLGRSSLDAMFAPHTTAEADFLSYGYGWRMQSTADGKRLIWHSGLDEAYGSMFRYYADEDIVVVFLSNQSIGGVPMRDILVPASRSGPPSVAIFADVVSAAPTYVDDGRRVAPYSGHYRVGDTGRWTLDVEGSAISLYAEGQDGVNALFPPLDDSVAAAYDDSNRAAERLGRCVADPACQSDDLDRIDPLGYAMRDAGRIRDDWQRHAARLGSLQEIRAISTTALRGRNPNQMITSVRLRFAGGGVEEHVIWFADNEIYWIPGRPSTMSIRFRLAQHGGLVGFDLLKQGRYHIEPSEEGITLTASNSGRRVHASREK